MANIGCDRATAAPSREIVVREGAAVLRIRPTTRYHCARFELEGTMEERTAPVLASVLAAACVDPDVTVIALDLRHVTFLGAAGLTCLEATARLGLRHGVRMSVWDASPFVRRVLRAGGLDSSVLIEPTEH